MTWSHPVINESGECGVVVQLEHFEKTLPTSGEPCKVWILWNGKTKMAWTVPEMIKRIIKPVQN